MDKSYLTEKVLVYNFVVEDWHTYFVGEDRFWVHNTLGDCGMVVSKASEVVESAEKYLGKGGNPNLSVRALTIKRKLIEHFGIEPLIQRQKS